MAKPSQPAESEWHGEAVDLVVATAETASRATYETTLVLCGTTTDTAALERYLVALGEERLFVKVEMASLEANPEQRTGTWRFSARVTIRPG
jgi:Tfp pilus assembly protein PilN